MRDDYSKQDTGEFEPFPVLQSKGADGQQRIEAVADALGWDAARLAELGGLLAQEPPVRGLAYGQYGDGTNE